MFPWQLESAQDSTRNLPLKFGQIGIVIAEMIDFVIFSVGWVVGEVKSKAISAFNQVEVEVEAEFGNLE